MRNVVLQAQRFLGYMTKSKLSKFNLMFEYDLTLSEIKKRNKK